MCAYVYLSISIQIHRYIPTYTHAYIIHKNIYGCVCMHVYMYIYIHMCVYVNTHKLNICLCVCMCAFIYIPNGRCTWFCIYASVASLFYLCRLSTSVCFFWYKGKKLVSLKTYIYVSFTNSEIIHEIFCVENNLILIEWDRWK